MSSKNTSEGQQFHPETYFKFVPKDLTRRGFTYKLGLNHDTIPFKDYSYIKCCEGGLYYTTIDYLQFFESRWYGNYILIIKIPIDVPIVEIRDTESIKYKSPCVYVESIHLYTDFLKDNTIVPEIKRKMKVPDLRFNTKMKFHPETYFKLVPLNSVYKLGLNVSKISCGEGFTFTTIDHIREFEGQDVVEDLKILIIKIPVDIPVEKEISSGISKISIYTSHCIFIESIHLYTDFFEDDTILPNLKKSMRDPDLRIGIFGSTKEACMKTVKKYPFIIGCFKKEHPCLDKKEEPYWSSIGGDLPLGFYMNFFQKKNLKNENPFVIDKQLCLQAVKNDGKAIRYLMNSEKSFLLDREVCLEALKNDGDAIFYIRDTQFFDKEMCLEAIKNKGDSIRFIINSQYIDRKLCFEVVKKNGYYICYIINSRFIDREICLAAVKNDGYAILIIKDTPFIDKEICNEAIKQNPNVIEFVKDLRCFQ